MNMMNHFFPEVNTNRDEWIVMMEDLFKSFHSIHSILSIIVDKESANAQFPIVIDRRFGRSNHSIFNINSIPRITNELLSKLRDPI